MLFEKEKYYKYIRILEKNIIFLYIVIILFSTILGIAIAQGIGFILGIGIGFLIATNYTVVLKIKIQKMKWEIDIYELLRK